VARAAEVVTMLTLSLMVMTIPDRGCWKVSVQ
jgi:hypothetical protein